MAFRVLCQDCEFEEVHEDRYIAAANRDTHADETEHFEGEAHAVEYEEVGDGE